MKCDGGLLGDGSGAAGSYLGYGRGTGATYGCFDTVSKGDGGGYGDGSIGGIGGGYGDSISGSYGSGRPELGTIRRNTTMKTSVIRIVVREDILGDGMICRTWDDGSQFFYRAQGELYSRHREDGPAVIRPTPWGLDEVHYLFGVRRTKAQAEPWDKGCIDAILSTRNIEARRIMIEAYGIEKFAEDAGAECVDLDVTRHDARALMRIGTGDATVQYLVATDGSTGRVYWMPVAADAKTCADAHESICWISDDLLEGGS